MPAYSYKERFVPFILDGSKTCTIRADRKGRNRHALPGDTIYLYSGMRTKWCQKIGEAICLQVQEVEITEEGVTLGPFSYQRGIYFDYGYPLSPEALDQFAWRDGFRPEMSTLEWPKGAWDLMRAWWKKTHQLPFKGVIISWADFVPAKDNLITVAVKAIRNLSTKKN